MNLLFRALALLLTTVILPAESLPKIAATDFIRIREDDESARLQTSLTTYTQGDTAVTLIGAIHIADQSYFERLNAEFTKFEVVLFELIGGEKAAKNLDGKPRPVAAKEGRPVEGLRALYSSFAQAMQLAQQIEVIDYTPANFVHADLTKAEYAAILAEEGNQVLAFSLESSIKNSELTQKPFGGLNMGLVMRAMLSGDGSLLKLEYMKMMEKGDESAAAITGDNVVITERNEKCFQVLSRELAKGAADIAIFYGAAHFPDMERRLREMGFTRSKHDWVTAWDVKKPAKPKAMQAEND